MSLIFIFLWATNQAKALTLEETFEFYKKLAGWKAIEFETLAKAEKKKKINWENSGRGRNPSFRIWNWRSQINKEK